MLHNFLIFGIGLVICWCLSSSNAVENAPKTYGIFSISEPSKCLHSSQLEQFLSTLAEAYKSMNERQKQDSLNIIQISNDLQLVNQRLQSIENRITQIEQTEFFNRNRLEQLAENSMKDSVQLDDLKRKTEKNQQQNNNYWYEADTLLGKFQNTQEIMQKEIRRLNSGQEKLSSRIEENKEDSDSKSDKLVQNLTKSQKLFEQDVKDLVRNSLISDNDKQFIKIVNADEISVRDNETNAISQILNSVFQINDKCNNLQEQTKLIYSTINKCASLTDKILGDMENQRLYVGNTFKSLLETVTEEIQSRTIDAVHQLQMTMKVNFDALLEGQKSFSIKCHRMQEHGEQLEDEAVKILEGLFQYINEKTESIRAELKNLSNVEQARNTYETNEIRKLSELMLSQNEHSVKESESYEIQPINLTSLVHHPPEELLHSTETTSGENIASFTTASTNTSSTPSSHKITAETSRKRKPKYDFRDPRKSN